MFLQNMPKPFSLKGSVFDLKTASITGCTKGNIVLVYLP